MHSYRLNGINHHANQACDDLDISTGASLDQNANDIPDECETVLGDATGDGQVNVADLLLVISNWGARHCTIARSCKIVAGLRHAQVSTTSAGRSPPMSNWQHHRTRTHQRSEFIRAAIIRSLLATRRSRLDGLCISLLALAQTLWAVPSLADCLPQWSAELGQPGMTQRVAALITFDDGMGGGPALYAGGSFTTAGGVASTPVARWNGSTWQSVGVSIPLSTVTALAVFDRGDGPALYAAGIGSAGLARWNGQNWSSIPGAPNSWLGSLFVHDFGDGPSLIVSGGFAGFNTIDGPTDYIARWDGANWRRVGAQGLISVAHDFAVFDAGAGPTLHAVGGFAFFNSGQPSVIGFGQFNGVSWQGAGGGFNGGHINALEAFDDGNGLALFAAGGFTAAGGTSTFGGAIAANRIARWDGAKWSALGAGLNGLVHDLAVFDADGTGPNPAMLYVAGEFTTAGGEPAHRLAAWDGQQWRAVGGAAGQGASAAVHALAVSHTADLLIVAGDFTTAGGLPANRIAAYICVPIVLGDVTGDGQVTVADLLAVITSWGPCPAPPATCHADISPTGGDGQVNVADLLLVIANWGG